jgi:hypothetical protein
MFFEFMLVIGALIAISGAVLLTIALWDRD